MAYKRLLIQQTTYDGSNYTNVGSVVDTLVTYRVACSEFPFMRLPESKEPASRDWYDENGEDVYIANNGLKFKAYDLEAEFIYVGSVSQIKTDLALFINFIYGRNEGGSPRLKIYDEYTQTGRRDVYVKSVSNDLYWNSDSDADKIATFKVTFRVNDPVTDVTLTTVSSSS